MTMTRADMTKSQGKAIHEAVKPMMGWLGRLQEKMIKKGFPGDDVLYAKVKRAHDAMHALCWDAYDITCDCVGDPPRPAGNVANDAKGA